MADHPACPRCGGPLVAGECAYHGPAAPLHPFVPPSPELLALLTTRSPLPYWLPWPLPRGWAITGAGYAGADEESARATVTAAAGPDPLDRSGSELLLICEEPGVGLGARYAWLAGPDPGSQVGVGVAEAHVHADGHPTPLWLIGAPTDRAVYAGEASGRWLWLVFFPPEVAALVLEPLEIADAGTLGHELGMALYGSLTPRLDHPEP